MVSPSFVCLSYCYPTSSYRCKKKCEFILSKQGYRKATPLFYLTGHFLKFGRPSLSQTDLAPHRAEQYQKYVPFFLELSARSMYPSPHSGHLMMTGLLSLSGKCALQFSLSSQAQNRPNLPFIWLSFLPHFGQVAVLPVRADLRAVISGLPFLSGNVVRQFG